MIIKVLPTILTLLSRWNKMRNVKTLGSVFRGGALEKRGTTDTKNVFLSLNMRECKLNCFKRLYFVFVGWFTALIRHSKRCILRHLFQLYLLFIYFSYFSF